MDGYETTDAIAPAETVDQAAPEVTEGAPEGTSAAPAETESFSTALEDLPEGDALTQEFLQERYRQM